MSWAAWAREVLVPVLRLLRPLCLLDEPKGVRGAHLSQGLRLVPSGPPWLARRSDSHTHPPPSATPSPPRAHRLLTAPIPDLSKWAGATTERHDQQKAPQKGDLSVSVCGYVVRQLSFVQGIPTVA